MKNQKTNYFQKTIGFILVLIVSVASSFNCMSQTYSQGQGFPAAITEESHSCPVCNGSQWANMVNVDLPDNQYTTTTMNQYPICFQNNCFYARALVVSDFGFSIPSLATIVGVKAEVLRKASFAQSAIDTIVHLMINGNAIGLNKFSSNFWPLSPAYQEYGDSTDTWGISLTPADVNSAGFGLFYKAVNDNSNISGVITSVDHVRMTVYFVDPTGVAESQVSDNMFSAYFDHAEQQIAVRTSHMKTTNAGVRVFNSMGQLVAEKNLANNATNVSVEKINASGLNEGIYFVELSSDEISFSKKILVSK